MSERESKVTKCYALSVKFFSFLAGILLIASTNTSNSTVIFVDTFTTGLQDLEQTGIGNISGSATSATILGGERDVRIDVFSGTADHSVKIDVSNSNEMGISSDGGVNAETLIIWDGLASSGLGGIDFSLFNTIKSFEFGLLFVDFPADLTLSVVDTSGNASALSKTTGSLITSLSVIDFAYADFVKTGAFDADFSSLDAISLLIDTPAGGDITVDFLRTSESVPEPGTMAFLIMGIGGMWMVKKKRDSV